MMSNFPSISTAASLVPSGLSVPDKVTTSVNKVLIRDGKTIKINDHVYISAPWAPGSGEPYLVARIMEFVNAASTSNSVTAHSNPAGTTLQVRANVYLRVRDISHRVSNDPRLLVATMHSDLFALDNIRGICEVRHRELIGDGSAPDVTTWKRRDDHFYFHQLYDRYIHRFYDVIPTYKIKNAPDDVLEALRERYSFIVAEVGMTADLCDALRGCATCHQWAASVESVRCATCKLFFHMRCLNPPLASKPAKGYSWTCGPCSKKYEQNVSMLLAGKALGNMPRVQDSGAKVPDTSTSSKSGTKTGTHTPTAHEEPRPSGRPRGRPPKRGWRGRPRGMPAPIANRLDGKSTASASGKDSVNGSAAGTPTPERNSDDVRGTRCFNKWPYRYFGQHTYAPDILDLHDSIYPRATTRLGPKFQASLPTWEEQKKLGFGVAHRAAPAGSTPEPQLEHQNGDAAGNGADPKELSAKLALAQANGTRESSPAAPVKRKPGRPPKRKLANVEGTETVTTTPVVATIALPSEDNEPSYERGGNDSIDIIYRPSVVPKEHIVDVFLSSVKQHFSALPGYSTDLIDRALLILCRNDGKAAQALSELSQSTPADLRIVNWSAKEMRQFEAAISDYNSEIKYLKNLIPTKTVPEIVRHFYAWKTKKLGEAHRAASSTVNGKAKGKSTVVMESRGNAFTTTRAVSPSLSIFGDAPPSSKPPTCNVCSTTSSAFWYKGPHAWHNRHLCTSCGVYWRRYAAETSIAESITANKRQAAATPANEDGGLGIVAPVKATKVLKTDNLRAAATPPPPVLRAPKQPATKCLFCKRMQPTKKLVQCRRCTMSVHLGCYGVLESEVTEQGWQCEACANERSLDAALIPRCVLCPTPKILDNSRDGPSMSSLTNGAIDVPPPQGGDLTLGKLTAISPLEAVKPTECNNWTHLICALWIPEILFADTATMKPVEGAGNLAPHRYAATCEICRKNVGACVNCSEPGCQHTYHVSCAWTVQPTYTFGFELQRVQMPKREGSAIVTFKGETGHLTAVSWCWKHKGIAKNHRLYDMGEVDPASGLTATQVFVQANKAVQPRLPDPVLEAEATYGLLRRARRLDEVLLASASTNGARAAIMSPSSRLAALVPNGRIKPEEDAMEIDSDEGHAHGRGFTAAPSAASSHCIRCGTSTTPFWWRVQAGSAVPGAMHSLPPSGAPQGSVACNMCRSKVPQIEEDESESESEEEEQEEEDGDDDGDTAMGSGSLSGRRRRGAEEGSNATSASRASRSPGAGASRASSAADEGEHPLREGQQSQQGLRRSSHYQHQQQQQQQQQPWRHPGIVGGVATATTVPR